jgi:hypothetical protein
MSGLLRLISLAAIAPLPLMEGFWPDGNFDE